MILNPAIIALLIGSALVSFFTLYAALQGWRINRSWDLSSGSELQLSLERKTYLISTILSWVLLFEIGSLFLFSYTADRFHDQFVGAMCAAGTLQVNPYGYPTLVVKMAAFLLCGIWIVLNHADNRAHDYPLVRTKYRLLLPLSGIMVLGAYYQMRYFAGLKADVITSCCGTLFSMDTEGVGGDLASLPYYGTALLLLSSMVLTLRTGVHVIATGRGARLFSMMSGWTTVLSLAAVISFVSVYYYELPTHHCPFCLLQEEYHYVGYPLYLSLFLAGICGVGTGVIDRMKGPASLSAIIPRMQRRLAGAALVGFMVFAGIAAYPMIFSDFILR